METQPKASAKDFFINLGAIVALYTTVVSLVNLLFTAIDAAYPKIINGYYSGSQSISWPVATLIIFFPIFLLLMWLLAKDYKVNPEKQNSGIHRWLTYITLFISGLAIAIDLITVLYYFLDGQELTTGFLLKVLVLLIIATGIFAYYLSDVRGKLTPKSRNIYRIISLVIIIASIVWGFSVLGSPATQRMYKYDEQKVSDLQNINNFITNFYQIQQALPSSIAESQTILNSNYSTIPTDPQTQKSYEYEKTSNTKYNLCAEFNKASNNKNGITVPIYSYPYDGASTWTHPAGHFCFNQIINPNMYPNEKVRP